MERRKARIILIVFTLSTAMVLVLPWTVASPIVAAPTTRYVAPHATCAGALPCYATLQAAIDAADLGDEIRVAQAGQQRTEIRGKFAP